MCMAASNQSVTPISFTTLAALLTSATTKTRTKTATKTEAKAITEAKTKTKVSSKESTKTLRWHRSVVARRHKLRF